MLKPGSDMSVTITLVDPSMFENDQHFKITCFGRSPRDIYLPAAERGQAILLRNVRTSAFTLYGSGLERVNGTVYHEKLSWVGYDPSDGKTFFANHGVEVDSGLPMPLYRAKNEELEYMCGLGLWWNAAIEEKGEIQIVGDSPQVRQQRLIADCAFDQFFDCTVEVESLICIYSKLVRLTRLLDKVIRLVVNKNGYGVSADVVFSDYSACNLLSSSGPYGQWAVHSTTTRVAEEQLDLMKEGTHWAVKNVRLKMPRGENVGVDLDLYNAEFTELLPHEQHPCLQSLLQYVAITCTGFAMLTVSLRRKTDYLKSHPPIASLNEYPKQSELDDITTLKEVKEMGHYNLIVEVNLPALFCLK